VSDGLIADLRHLADESGVAIEVATRVVPVHARLTEVASALGRDPMEWAMTGGDDHALAATFPDKASVPADWTPIGMVREGSGIVVDGQPWTGTGGWDHFGSAG
jgi:thiamine-monophosphate kinase